MCCPRTKLSSASVGGWPGYPLLACGTAHASEGATFRSRRCRASSQTVSVRNAPTATQRLLIVRATAPLTVDDPAAIEDAAVKFLSAFSKRGLLQHLLSLTTDNLETRSFMADRNRDEPPERRCRENASHSLLALQVSAGAMGVADRDLWRGREGRCGSWLRARHDVDGVGGTVVEHISREYACSESQAHKD